MMRLYHHIPVNNTQNEINTETELLYQNIIRDVSNLPEHNIDRIKTKLRSVWKNKYRNIKRQ